MVQDGNTKNADKFYILHCDCESLWSKQVVCKNSDDEKGQEKYTFLKRVMIFMEN
jgi:hypothetical protein